MAIPEGLRFQEDEKEKLPINVTIDPKINVDRRYWRSNE